MYALCLVVSSQCLIEPIVSILSFFGFSLPFTLFQSSRLSHNSNDVEENQPVDANNMIDTRITLSTKLYQAIEQQAQGHGCSVSSEIASTILAASLGISEDELADEFDAWEAASDEDWLKMETMLASEVNP
jgi:hypothetical protein